MCTDVKGQWRPYYPGTVLHRAPCSTAVLRDSIQPMTAVGQTRPSQGAIADGRSSFYNGRPGRPTDVGFLFACLAICFPEERL
jgi:hypothetical protein